MKSTQDTLHMKIDTSPINNNIYHSNESRPQFCNIKRCDNDNIWSSPIMSVSTDAFPSFSDPVYDSVSRLRNTFDPISNVNSLEKFPLLRPPGCSGYALFATKDGIVPCRGSLTMSTGISIKIPFGHYGKIEAVPLLGMRYDITPFGNIIDEKNNDIIYIKLLNNSNINYQVKKGDNIAQIIIQRYATPLIQYNRYNKEKRQHIYGFGPIGNRDVFK